MQTKAFPALTMSEHAQRTFQPVTTLSYNAKPSHSTKTLIKLTIGDPTLDGNIVAPAVVTQSMIDAVQSTKHNGYANTIGDKSARDAVAEYQRRFCDTDERKSHIVSENVIITSGVSHGVVLAITSLCNPGDNILVPAPSFPHYKSVCDSYGIECRYYKLLPENDWESDLDGASKMTDEKTRAMVIINPSNPCGSNFSCKHIQEIISFCEAKELPIIADEIYAELVFHGEHFYSVANFDTNVPCAVLSGTAKHNAVPGWRIGFITLIDPSGAAVQWLNGMNRLAQLITGTNSVAQQSVVHSLLKVPEEFIDDYVRQLEAGCKAYDRLQNEYVGLTFNRPRATLFIMIGIDYNYFADITTDMEFYEKLLDEENVQVLPGSVFGTSGFVRATISRPSNVLNEAIDRMIAFCERHKKEVSKLNFG